MFNHRTRMLASVERWNVAPRLQRQSVAEHSYYVALYTSELCEALHCSMEERHTALEYALRHDLPEIITSDIPGPAKRAIVDPEKLALYEFEFLQSIGHETSEMFRVTNHAKAIVKAADCIDAYFWLAMEVHRGNGLMRRELDIGYDRMSKALQAANAPHFIRAIEEEASSFLDGVELAPRLDTDLPMVYDPKSLPDKDDQIPF